MKLKLIVGVLLLAAALGARALWREYRTQYLLIVTAPSGEVVLQELTHGRPHLNPDGWCYVEARHGVIIHLTTDASKNLTLYKDPSGRPLIELVFTIGRFDRVTVEELP